MSILDDLRAEIGAVFSDRALFFSDATLTRVSGSGAWSEDATTSAAYPCKAMVDTYSDHLRAVSDIPGTDVKLMIVGTSVEVDPLKEDSVTIAGRDYRLIEVATDPARAMWTCQARPV